MADIFDTGFSTVSDKEWRAFLDESSRPLVDAPTSGRSQTANFAKQLADAQRAEQNAIIDANNASVKLQNEATKAAEKAAKETAKQAKLDAKALREAGLPDITEQKPLPLNWFEAKKATDYDNKPYVEQQRIYGDWLDQAQVSIVTANPSKAATARAELEAKIPMPTKPKADFGDTDILDKMNVGARSLLEGGAKVAAAFMDEGASKQSVLQFASEQAAAKQEARQNFSPETLDAEKMTAFKKQQLIEKYGSEDAIPAWEGFKQGVSSMTQGGVVQTIGNVGQSLASSAPSVAGNAMRIAGAGLTATGGGAVLGVPLMAAGTGLATLGGAISTAADVGSDVNEEAIKLYEKQGLSPKAARIKAEAATRTGALAGAVVGGIEGLVGAKLGAGSAVKAGVGSMAKKATIETASEGVAEGVGRTAVNATLINEGDNRSLTRGVAEAAAQGAIGGLGMAAGGHALAQATGAKEAQTESGPAPIPLVPQANTPQAPVQTPVSNIPALEAAAAAQDALEAAQAKGDPAEIAVAQATFEAARKAAIEPVATEATTTPAAVENVPNVEALRVDAETKTAVAEATPKEDPAYPAVQQAATDAREAYQVAIDSIAANAVETNRVADAAITDMLTKIEAIGGGISDYGVSFEPLAGAIGRSEGMLVAQAAKRPWALDIAKGVEPIVAVASDATIEPAQRAAAQAVIAAFEATGTPLPKYETTNPPRGSTSGSMSHSNINPAVPGVLKLNRKSAGIATIIHENVHALTVLGLEQMRRSGSKRDKDVLAGLDAIMDFIEQHAAIRATKAGAMYAAKNRFELLAESMSGRALPFTSQYTVQDVIDAGELSQGAIEGLMILTNRQPTTLQQLFAKARDYVLKAMGLAAARKGSISDAVLAAQDIAMNRQSSMLVENSDETLAPGYSYAGKNATGNYATSLSQLVQGLPQKYEGIYTTADGTAIDPNDSLASVASKPAVVALLKAKGFDGFKTEGGETFSLTNNDSSGNFDAWFNGSKVVDKQGNPLKMYTSTSSDVDFKKFKMPRNGTWFTMWADSASDYAIDNDSKGLKYNPDTRKYDDVNSASRVLPVYLRIVNPYPMTSVDMQRVNVANYKAAQAKLFDELRAKGYDGVQWSPAEWVAIGSANQIKSAIGNNGDFSLSSPLINNDETPQAKAITAQVANIQRVIVSKRTTNEQRLTYVARFLNGTHDADVMNAINETGVGLTVRASRETRAPWAEAVHYGDKDLLQAIATGASDVGQGAAAQARAVLRMYMEAGQDLPKVVKIDGLIPFGDKEAMGQYIPEHHTVELSDLSDPSHAVHEYLHGVTQLGVDAASRSPEGKALKSVMQYMLTSMRTTVVREGETKPYGLENEHEMMGELFSPSLLSVAARTPIGTPQSKAAQKMIAELMGEKPGTMIQLLDALIRKIVSYIGVKTVPNNMAELLSRVAARAVDETRKAVNDGIAPADALDRPALAPESAAFKLWFGNSKVVDASGKPLVVYHGTGDDISRFKDGFARARKGFYFTSNPEFAGRFAEDAASGIGYESDERAQGASIVPVYLSLQNPIDTTAGWPISALKGRVSEVDLAELQDLEPTDFWIGLDDDLGSRVSSALKASGFDGVKATEGGNPVFVAFEPNQIKSATGNSGNYDGSSLFINDEVLPSGTVPLSMNTLGQTLTGRMAGGDYINNITAGVNVEPVLLSSKVRMLAAGESSRSDNFKQRKVNQLNDLLHDAQGPAKRWIMSLPISEAARRRISDLLYLAPGKRDNALTDAMENHGGNDVLAQLSDIKRSTKGLTYETITSWVGHWITANHVAEKNDGLVAKRKSAADEAAVASMQKPNDMRLALAAARAQQAYQNQVDAVNSTDLNAGTEQGPAHKAGVAGGLNNAQAAALMAAVEGRIPVDKLKAVAERVYDLNAYRLTLDIESGKANIVNVQTFLKLSDADTLKLQALHDAARDGTATEDMRNEVRALVRSEYVPMTGHPMSSIDGAEAGVFGAGSAQPNSQKNFTMEGRTRGVADNGIATTLSGLVKSATFHGYADFTTGIGEAYDMLSDDQRAAVGITKHTTKGTTRGGDNVILDGRKNNEVSYTIQDPAVLDAIRKSNVAEHDYLLQNSIGKLTKGFAYLVTQANPIFGVKNLINDVIERSLVLSTREYFTASGGKTTIGAMKMVANTGTAFGAVNRLLRGTADYSQEADIALRDLVAAGGMSISRDVFARDAVSLSRKIRAAGDGAMSARGVVHTVGSWIDKWNKQFDMVSPLASYLALRQAGVTEVDAAGGALDLMNFRKKGAAMGNISQVYAFAQPAVTGGANMLGALSTKKGLTIAATSLIGFAALQALAEAGADDDEGGNLLRQLPDYARNQNLNVQVGDYVISVPLGFGTTRLAKTVGRIGSDMVYKDKGAGEALVDIVKEGLVPALLPIEDTKIKDPLKKVAFEFTPTALKPLAALALNVDSQGNQIDREKWIDPKQYRHMQGSKTIAPQYRDLAALTFEMSGGMLDLTPEAAKTVIQGYSLGLFKTLVAETITNPHRESQGKDTPLPIVGSLLSSVAKPINEDAWKGQVRAAQQELDELKREEAKLEASSNPDDRVALRDLQRKPEYKLLQTYDELDKRLRAESARVTRSENSGQITEKAAKERKDTIRERRSVEEAKFLVQWRKAKGLNE